MGGEYRLLRDNCVWQPARRTADNKNGWQPAEDGARSRLGTVRPSDSRVVLACSHLDELFKTRAGGAGRAGS